MAQYPECDGSVMLGTGCGFCLKCRQVLADIEETKTEEEALSVENINDHKAFICGCGSVHFNLLKSLGIECSGCGKQFGRWREVGVDSGLLFAAMREIVDRIENCGASPELTAAVSLASDLSSAIGNKFNDPDVYALERVKAELNT